MQPYYQTDAAVGNTILSDGVSFGGLTPGPEAARLLPSAAACLTGSKLSPELQDGRMEVMGYSLQLEGEGHAAAHAHNGTWRAGAGRMAACRPQLYSDENQNSFADVHHDKKRQFLAKPPSQIANGPQSAHASSSLRGEVRDTLPNGRAHLADLGQSLQRHNEHEQQPLPPMQHTPHVQPSCIQNFQCGSQPLDRGPPGTWQPMHFSSQPSSSAPARPTHNLHPYSSGGGSQPEHIQPLKRPFEDLSNGSCAAVGRARPSSDDPQTSVAGLIHQQARHQGPSQADRCTDHGLQQCFGAVGSHQTYAPLAVQQTVTHMAQPQPPYTGIPGWQQQQQHQQQAPTQLPHQRTAGSWHPLHSGLQLLQQGAGVLQQPPGQPSRQQLGSAIGQPHAPLPPPPSQQQAAPHIWPSQQRPPHQWQRQQPPTQDRPPPPRLPPPQQVAPQGQLQQQVPLQAQWPMASRNGANLHSQPQRTNSLDGQRVGQHGPHQLPAPASMATSQAVCMTQGRNAAGGGPHQQGLSTTSKHLDGHIVLGQRQGTDRAQQGTATAALRPSGLDSAAAGSGCAPASAGARVNAHAGSVRHEPAPAPAPAPAPQIGTSGVDAGTCPGAAAAAANAPQHDHLLREDQHKAIAAAGQQQTVVGSAVQPQHAEAAGRSGEGPGKRAVQGGEAASVDEKRMDREPDVEDGGAASVWQPPTGQQGGPALPDEQQGTAAPAQQQPVAALGMPPIDKIKRPLRRLLSQWIPHPGVVGAFAEKGVKELYPWQAAALESGEDGHNLVYCAPTSGGKSMVAEVLMIRRLLAAFERHAAARPPPPPRGRRVPPPARALLVLPYVSIVAEKAEHLERVMAPMLRSVGGRVGGYAGADTTASPLGSPDEVVAVVTMEKANSTVNRLLQERRLHELCCVVVDEAHMVGDPHRGVSLELCLTKLRFAAAMAEAAHTREQAAAGTTAAGAALGPAAAAAATALAPGSRLPALASPPAFPSPPSSSCPAAAPPFSCQLVCMSATMAGLDAMCSWLGARLFMTNFRPVPLTEHAVFKGIVYKKLQPKELQQQQEQLILPASDPAAGTAAATQKQTGAHSRQAPSASDTAAGLVTASTAAGNGAAVSTNLPAVAGAAAAVPLVELRSLPDSDPRVDADRVAVLVAEVAREGHSTLVFCASRNACQSCAGMLCKVLPQQLPQPSEEVRKGRRELLDALQDASGGYLNEELERLIVSGVAYHHAGLTFQERAAVERGFRAGLIHTLTATSTLAAGINLPARRVILRSLTQGVGPVSRAQYLQMIGRAGRAGQSPVGEAFLIGKGAPFALGQGSEWPSICRLLTAPLPPLRSCLLDLAAGEGQQQHQQAGGEQTAAAKGLPPLPGMGMQQPRLRAAADDSAIAGGGLRTAAPGGTQQAMPGSSAAAAATGSGGPEQETHLQRMLLEAIANESASSGTSIELLIRSTLLRHQLSSEAAFRAATYGALVALRSRKLVTFVRAEGPTAGAGQASSAATGAAAVATGPAAAAAAAGAKAPEGGAVAGGDAAAGVAGGGGGREMGVWRATKMGKAVYDSCLPIEIGEDLYSKLSRARDGLALEGGLHLLYHVLADPPAVAIDRWDLWAARFKAMPQEPHKRVAAAVGVAVEYAERVSHGGRSSAAAAAAHCRFATACLLHDLICEGDLHQLEQDWGGGLSKRPITRGELQKLQADVSKHAALAAVIAGSCDWWGLQALLESISAQAAAGARPELLPLMALADMTGARARALHAAGFTRPALLAAADEEDVKKALAASLPRNLRAPKPKPGAAADREAAAAAAAVSGAGNALLARGARSLVAAARRHLADVSARLAREEEVADMVAEGADDETKRLAMVAAAERLAGQLKEGATAAAIGVAEAGEGGRGAALGSVTGAGPLVAGASAHGGVAVGLPAPASLRGCARVRELSDASSSQEQLDAFLKAWRDQPSFAIALLTSEPLDGAGDGAVDGSSEAGSGPGGASALLDPATGERLAVTPGGKGVPVPGMPAPACAGGSRRKRWREGGGGEAGDGAARGLAIVGLVVCWSHTEATLLLFGDAGSGGSGSKSSSSSSASSGSSDRRRNGEDGRVDGKLGAETARAGCMSGQGSGVRSGDRALEGARGPGCAAASGGSGSRLWGAVCEMLSYGGSCKVCWQAEAQLAALMAAGCTAGGQWDDPRVMAWMAQGSTSLQEISLPELQRSVLPAYAVRVPLQRRADATAACRTALLCWSLAGPLRGALAAQQGLAEHYRLVEAPLTLELARTRVPTVLRRLQPCGEPKAPSNPAPKRRPPAAPISATATDALPTQLRPDAAAPTAGTVLPPPSSPATASPPAATYALRLDVPACQAQLALLRDTQATCCHVASRLLGRPVGLSSDAHVEALCMREHLVRRRGRPPLDLAARCAVELHSRRMPSWHVFVPKDGLPPAVRHRAAQLGVLVTRHVAARALAEVLQGLLVAAGVGDGDSEDDGGRSMGHQPASATAGGAVGTAVGLTAAVGVGLHRAGLEGGMGVRTAGSTGQAGPGASESGGGAVAGAGAAARQFPARPDEMLVVTEISSAPHPAPPLQQQYCAWPEGEAHLQAQLPLAVLFAEQPWPSTDAPRPLTLPAIATAHTPSRLRPGLLVALAGPGPRAALDFDAGGGADGRSHTCLVAAPDTLTGQPSFLQLPATAVWAASATCGPDMAAAAAAAGQLAAMTHVQVLRCPGEELLLPAPGCTLLTIAYPYLALAVTAHCTADERLVEALYQGRPWAAVAAAWLSSQHDELRRLLPSAVAPPPQATTDPVPADASGPSHTGTPAPAPETPAPSPSPALEQVCACVVHLGLVGGGSHGELAEALGEVLQHGGGAGGGKAAAAALVASFMAAFPGVERHKRELETLAKKEGHIPTPCGQLLRPPPRSLTAGGVAASQRLQRRLLCLQLGAAAAQVVRTAAALGLARCSQALKPHGRPAPGTAQQGLALPGAAVAAGQSVVQGGGGGVVEGGGAAASAAEGPRVETGGGVCADAAVRLAWCSALRVVLCVPAGGGNAGRGGSGGYKNALGAALRGAQEAGSAGVMGRLGLRVPLHVSVYVGAGVALERCSQHVAGEERDGQGGQGEGEGMSGGMEGAVEGMDPGLVGVGMEVRA